MMVRNEAFETRFIQKTIPPPTADQNDKIITTAPFSH